MSKCTACGAVLKDGARFCTKCGVKVDEKSYYQQNTYNDDEKKTKSGRKAKRKKSKVKFVVFLFVFLIICVAVGVCTLWYLSPEQRISRAVNSEDYSEVIDIIVDYGIHSDSPEVSEPFLEKIAELSDSFVNEEMGYQIVISKLEKIRAMDIRHTEQDVRDAISMVKSLNESRTFYKEAESLYEAGDFQGAIQNYIYVTQEDSNFKDAQSKILTIKDSIIYAINEDINNGSVVDAIEKLAILMEYFRDDEDILTLFASCEGASAEVAKTIDVTDGKIAIITATENVDTDTYKVAQNKKMQLGNSVKAVSYPENCTLEQLISTIKSVSIDPYVKVITIVGAEDFSVEAIEEVKKIREDIVFICSGDYEDIEEIKSSANIFMQVEDVSINPAVLECATSSAVRYFAGNSLFESESFYKVLSENVSDMDKIAVYVNGKRTYDQSEYVMPGVDTRYYTEEELKGLSEDDLQLRVNEIYARHGHVFKSQRYKEYFESKSWYVPVKGKSDSTINKEMNKYEKANLNLLLEMQKKL